MAPRRVARLALLFSGVTGLALAQGDVPVIPDPPAHERPSPTRTRQPLALTYFLYIDGKQWGPYTVAQLREMAAAKNFYQDDLVWKEGATEWKRAQNYPELSAFALANDQPPAPEIKPAEPQTPEPVAEAEPAMPGEAEPDQQVAATQAVAPDAAAPDTTPPDAGPDGPPTPPPDAVKKPVPATQYYVSVQGAATGPFGLDEIKQKIADGVITTGTYLWWKGADWTAADKIAELSSSFAAKPPAPPFDCEGFIVGVWQRDSFYSGHLVSLRTRYDPGGQYSGSQAMAGLPGSTLYGTWTARAVGERACSLALKQQYPDATQRTLVFDIIDRDTMKDQSDDGIARRL